MKKNKILISFLAISFLTSTHIAFSADSQNKKNIKPASKTLEASVEDYRLEYINKDWWDKFQDPILKEYIFKSVSDNYDLKIATLRVQEAKATIQEYLGKEFPSLGLGTGFSRDRSSGNVSSLQPDTRNTYLFPLSVNYELDLWRKNRETTIGKKKEFEAVQYNEKAAYISLCSTVAATYFNVISTDKQIQLQEEIVELRKNIFDLTKENYNQGLYTAADVTQADKSLTEAQSGLNDLKKQQSILLNQLAVLTGNSSDNSSSLKRASIDKIDLIKDLSQDIQSEVVQKRPDILKAEAELQKSRIDVSLARKDFLPDFLITGQFGFNSTSFSKIFNWDSYIASIGANMAQSVFSGGQKRARLKIKKYQYEEMLNSYQKTILQSFQEVNDSLASLKFDSQKNNDNINRINSEKENFSIILNKYDYGAISYLDTLQYKERVISLQKEQIQSKTDCLIDSLSLYKAVGGKL